MFKLVVSLLAIMAATIFGQTFNGVKVHVAVYYESLCPDSINFIQEQLATQYSTFGDSINLQLVPFGKSSSQRRGSSFEFQCQHGPEECRGNKIQSCALNLIGNNNQELQVQFVACQMQRGADPTGEYCASSVGLQFSEVAECEVNGLGTQLQLEAEADTRNVAHPRRQLSFVPTIVYNYEFNQAKQQRSLYDFEGQLCEEIISTGAPIPQICAHRG